MDPLLFGIKGDLVLEVLGTIILISLFVERALSLVFEWRIILISVSSKGLKEPIALVTSFLVVYFYKFDAMAVIFSNEKNSLVGFIITAAVIAGGSKGFIKLFRDYLNWKSSAQDDYDNSKKKTRNTRPGNEKKK